MILTPKEKKYLENLIKPFKERVISISCKPEFGKIKNSRNFIYIDLGNDDIMLPYYIKGDMYNGMEIEKEYTLEELGLFDIDIADNSSNENLEILKNKKVDISFLTFQYQANETIESLTEHYNAKHSISITTDECRAIKEWLSN